MGIQWDNMCIYNIYIYTTYIYIHYIYITTYIYIYVYISWVNCQPIVCRFLHTQLVRADIMKHGTVVELNGIVFVQRLLAQENHNCDILIF